ncbi:MAG: response regulator [Desulfamplus sp.]|nr:response regulator [Desulfamplus sp.]
MDTNRQTGNRSNIVLVDDIPANLRLLAGILSDPDYTIRPIPDPVMALNVINAEPPDIILLDIIMPEMSGYTVCQTLKANPLTQNIPVIFITAKDDVQDKLKGFSLGAVDYITKPFEAQEVMVRVQTHLKLYNLQKNLQQKTDEMLTLNRQLEHENQKRRRVEAELKKSYLWLNSVFNALEEAVIIQTPDRIIMDVNQAAEKMFGYTKEDLKQRSLDILLVDTDHYLELERMIEQAFDKGENISFEYRAKRKNGDIFPTENSVAFLKNQGDKCMGIINVVRDVTKKKEAEERLKESEKLQTVLEITGAVCHELNQPLMSISGYSELALMDLSELNPVYIKLKKIRKQVERMGEITRKLMHISRYRVKDYTDGKIIDLVKASKSD